MVPSLSSFDLLNQMLVRIAALCALGWKKP